MLLSPRHPSSPVGGARLGKGAGGKKTPLCASAAQKGKAKGRGQHTSGRTHTLNYTSTRTQVFLGFNAKTAKLDEKLLKLFPHTHTHTNTLFSTFYRLSLAGFVCQPVALCLMMVACQVHIFARALSAPGRQQQQQHKCAIDFQHTNKGTDGRRWLPMCPVYLLEHLRNAPYRVEADGHGTRNLGIAFCTCSVTTPQTLNVHSPVCATATAHQRSSPFCCPVEPSEAMQSLPPFLTIPNGFMQY